MLEIINKTGVVLLDVDQLYDGATTEIKNLLRTVLGAKSLTYFGGTGADGDEIFVEEPVFDNKLIKSKFNADEFFYHFTSGKTLDCKYMGDVVVPRNAITFISIEGLPHN